MKLANPSPLFLSHSFIIDSFTESYNKDGSNIFSGNISDINVKTVVKAIYVILLIRGKCYG